MPRTRLNRLGLLLLAVFQLLLPAFASVADAQAEAASERGAVAHIESHGTSSCVPVHPADCAICQVVAGGATVSRAPAIRVSPESVISVSLPTYDGQAVGALARRDPSQRAPPVV